MSTPDGFYEWMQRFRALPNDVEPPDDTEGPQDPPRPGRCVVGRHLAARTWLVPRDGNRYCAIHLARIVYVAGYPWQRWPPAG